VRDFNFAACVLNLLKFFEFKSSLFLNHTEKMGNLAHTFEVDYKSMLTDEA
jgi:hypothetical protein